MKQIVCDRTQIQQDFTCYWLSLSPKQNSFCVWLAEHANATALASENDLEARISECTYGEFALYRSELTPEWSWLDYGIVYIPKLGDLSVTCQPHLVSREYPWQRTALDKIQNWISTCEGEHKLCPPKHSTAPPPPPPHPPPEDSTPLPERVLPKRVLKIVNDHVSLIISSEEEVQDYVALSYRWGDGLPLKLTEEAMGAFIQGRPISELSKTLQDAVHISRNLGFEYLWIDALCIIQGDEADWADQSAKMADIYRHSSLNLCAADSAGCGSGMVEMAAPHLMEIAASPAQSANLTETVVLLGGPIARAVIDVSGCGLQSRGWVFQEGLCSSRGLYISCRHDLWWGCRTMIDTIDACKPPITGDTDHAFNPLTLRRSFFLDDGEMSAQDFAFTWYDWMEQYTLRDLTLRTDRLPAVAGMAKYIAKVSEMKYTAGLWEGDLLCGLVWHRGGSDYARRMPGSAPTWSWASVTGPIYYDEFFTMHVDKRGQIKECREPDLDITETTVEEERTIEGGEELSFGNVQRGEIKASGVLKDAVTMLLEEGRRWSPKWDFDIQPPEPKEEFLNECHVPRLVSAWRYKEHTRPTVYFLIVRKTGQRYGEYQRVGLGYVKLSYKQHPKRHMFSVRRSNRDDREKSGFTEQDIWGKDPKRSQLILVRNRKH